MLACTNLTSRVIAAVTASAILLAAGPAWAEMTIIDSTSGAYKSNAKLADETVFELKDGETLKLIRSSDGTIHQLNGPYRGKLKDYANRPKKSLWERAFGKKKAGEMRRRRGGTVGGTRGIKKNAPVGGARRIE